MSFRRGWGRTIFEHENPMLLRIEGGPMDPSANDSERVSEQLGCSVPSVINETEGAGEQRVPFADAVVIGREDGDILIPTDPYLSQRHARIERSANCCHIHDCRSTNGTFVQIRQPIELRPGDEILIG